MKRSLIITAVILAMTLVMGMPSALAAEPGVHTITVTAEHGTPYADNPASAEAGDIVHLIGAAADSGYVFESCAVSGVDEGDYEEYVSVYPDFAMHIDEMPEADVTIHVVFGEAVTVTYDANGGATGPLWRDELPILKGRTGTFEIFDELIAPPEGKEYDGVTANGVRVGPTDDYVFQDDVTVVYQWKNPGEDTAPTCAVTFDLNGGTVGPRWEGDTAIGNGSGAVLPVRDDYDVVPPAGKEFAGLTVDGVLYAPGEDIPVAGVDAILAVFTWKDAPGGGAPTEPTPDTPAPGTPTPGTPAQRVTVTLDPNGGMPSAGWEDVATLEIGERVIVPTAADFDGIGIAPPEGKAFAGMELNGVIYAPGEPFTVPSTDFSVKFLWEDAAHTPAPTQTDGADQSAGGDGGRNASGQTAKDSLPRTGDESNIALWALALAASALGLAAALKRGRKNS